MDPVILQRDCEASLIPSGEPVHLKAGEAVEISQVLGGAFAVSAAGRLLRIEGHDADALGRTTPPKPESAPLAVPGARVQEQQVWEQLRTCYDPEIPVNLVDLGLIYDLQVLPMPEGGNRVEVKMTLTAPGCSMAGYIAQDVETKIRAIPNVTDVKVELVWDPPWNQAMLTEAARLQLGLM